MRKNVLFLLSCISGAAIQLLATARPAEAAYRYVAGFHCEVDKGSYNATLIDNTGRTDVSGNSIYLMCALTTDEVLSQASMSYLEVTGYDGANYTGVSAHPCVTFYTQHGYYCDPPTESPATYTGPYTLTPSISGVQTYPDDYAFVWVVLPSSPLPSQPSSVSGIYYE
jgi:hypothetical protein